MYPCSPPADLRYYHNSGCIIHVICPFYAHLYPCVPSSFYLDLVLFTDRLLFHLTNYLKLLYPSSTPNYYVSGSSNRYPTFQEAGREMATPRSMVRRHCALLSRHQRIGNRESLIHRRVPVSHSFRCVKLPFHLRVSPTVYSYYFDPQHDRVDAYPGAVSAGVLIKLCDRQIKDVDKERRRKIALTSLHSVFVSRCVRCSKDLKSEVTTTTRR